MFTSAIKKKNIIKGDPLPPPQKSAVLKCNYFCAVMSGQGSDWMKFKAQTSNECCSGFKEEGGSKEKNNHSQAFKCIKKINVPFFWKKNNPQSGGILAL